MTDSRDPTGPPAEPPLLLGRKCMRSGRCCTSNPGWLAPGEAEAIANHLGMDMGELVNGFLVLDHLQVTIGRVEVFAPVKLDEHGEPVCPAGEKTDGVYRHQPGSCIFFDGTGCTIYPVRPIECRHYSCIHPPSRNISRERIANLWIDDHLRKRQQAAQGDQKQSFFSEL